MNGQIVRRYKKKESIISYVVDRFSLSMFGLEPREKPGSQGKPRKEPDSGAKGAKGARPGKPRKGKPARSQESGVKVTARQAEANLFANVGTADHPFPGM